MTDIHDVFHVSQLKRCLSVPAEQTPMETMDLQLDLQYQERPVKILDTDTQQTRRTAVRFSQVQWSNHTEAEATGEREDDLKNEFPYLFDDQLESRGRDSSKGGMFITP